MYSNTLEYTKSDQKQPPTQKFITSHANHATCSTTSVYMWSALFPTSNHSRIRQLQFATRAFSQQSVTTSSLDMYKSILQYLNMQISLLDPLWKEF